jgi:hypothetical protein
VAKNECPECGGPVEVIIVRGMRRYKCKSTEGCKSNGYLGKVEKTGAAQSGLPVSEVPCAKEASGSGPADDTDVQGPGPGPGQAEPSQEAEPGPKRIIERGSIERDGLFDIAFD